MINTLSSCREELGGWLPGVSCWGLGSWRYLAASDDTITGAALGQSRAVITPQPAPRQLTSALSPTLSLLYSYTVD